MAEQFEDRPVYYVVITKVGGEKIIEKGPGDEGFDHAQATKRVEEIEAEYSSQETGKLLSVALVSADKHVRAVASENWGNI